jgi:hypothetical protein
LGYILGKKVRGKKRAEEDSDGYGLEGKTAKPAENLAYITA